MKCLRAAWSGQAFSRFWKFCTASHFAIIGLINSPIGRASCGLDFDGPFSSAFRKSAQGPGLPRFTWNLARSEEHTSELQSLMRNSYAVLSLKTNKELNSLK